VLLKIKCPKCGIEGTFSLADLRYEGPYRCWKCRELFSVLIEKNELKSCQPLGQEEFKKQQELKSLRSKFKKSDD
jgi:DNA-directed RNA polymerase subunit RPC12/RpoP